MGFDEYIKAGKIAGEVRENVRKTDWVGKTVYEICEHVESEIRKRGAKCAFPVNTSINEVAAHYTAEPNDEITITDDDLVKIDKEDSSGVLQREISEWENINIIWEDFSKQLVVEPQAFIVGSITNDQSMTITRKHLGGVTEAEYRL